MPESFVSWESAVAWLLDQPDRQDLVRQCYFDRPVLDAVRRYADSREWKEVYAHWLPRKAGLALDVGAGNGIVSYALATAGWTVAALEPDPSNFVGAGAIRAIAKSENLPINVVEEFGESMPFRDQMFDLVIARQVLHHADDLDKMFHEIERLLKPGGTFLGLRDHVVDDARSLQEFRDNHPLHSLYGGENAFRLSEYQAAIQNSGLVIVRQFQQFESVVNFWPKTKRDICGALSGPLRRFGVDRLVASPIVFRPLMSLASRLYRKPGRLVSFICRKPAST